MKAFALAPIALALAACATTPDTVRNGPVSFNETARVGDLGVTPTDLVEDSRCPADAQCVWAGRVVITAVVAGDTATETRTLVLGDPIVAQGQSLTLSAVLPGKAAESETPRADYRFTFE